jgi:hypothetical protein
MKMEMKMKLKIKMRKFIPPILLALGALFAATAANSTTLVRMSVAQLTHAAQLVVRARCVANSTAWNHGEIWTFTSFAVEETWKGARNPNSNEVLTVRLLGGAVGNLTSNVSAVPRFVPGEEVILFLEPIARGDFSVVSWIQGTFRIRRDIRTDQQIAVQDTASFDTFDPSTREFQASGLRHIAIEDLHRLVNSATCVTADCAAQGTK